MKEDRVAATPLTGDMGSRCHLPSPYHCILGLPHPFHDLLALLGIGIWVLCFMVKGLPCLIKKRSEVSQTK